jgi:hypothetical protein
VHVDAKGAAVDLRDAQVDELAQAQVQAGGGGRLYCFAAN